MSRPGLDTLPAPDAIWNSAGFFRIQCGKIAENWVVADTLGWLVMSGDITAEKLVNITAEATPAP